MKQNRMKLPALLLSAGLLCPLISCTAPGEPSVTTDSRTEQVTEPQSEHGTGDTANPDGVSIVANGVADFRIVRTGSTDATLAGAAEKLQRLIRMLTKAEIPVIEPLEAEAGERLIVVGTSAGIDAVQNATDALDIGEYGYLLRENVLMVIGQCDVTLNRALSAFTSALTAAAEKGTLTLKLPESGVSFRYDGWLQGVPRIGKAFSSVYDCGNQTYQLLYRNTDAAACDELEGLLGAQEGYSRSQGGTLGENRFATYVCPGGEVSYLYQPSAKTLRVVCQSYAEHYVGIPSVEPETGYTKTGETQFALLPLNYEASCANPSDCSGFSAVMTLEDGRFIIIDGGYAADADGLYNYLSDHNRRTDGITVAAWILTHAHGDHIGCFKQFAKDYGARVTVSCLITNALPENVKPTAEANSSDLARAEGFCGAFAGETQIIKMHAGQRAWFCNVEMQMLFTQETLHPARVQYLNETSTVFMLRAGGQNILITADCELQETDALVRLWGDALKSDFYQINHHGYSGVTNALIRAVDPTVALWPTSEATAAGRRQTAWYNELKKRIGECIVADAGAKILTLPYQPGSVAVLYEMDFTKRDAKQ